MQNELYHYGVKGMRWGVRREIGNQSREAARIRLKYNKATKRVKKT